MDRLEAMSLLVEVAKAGSLSAAGRRLNMPLATVSRKISDLEVHLGSRIFTRTTRRIDLTDAGRGYIAAASRILEDVAEAERTVAGEYSAPKGELVVTAPAVFGRMHVLPVALEFLKSYPDVDLHLILTDSALNLIDEHIDMAVRIGPLPDSDLIAARIGTLRQVACASPEYLVRKGVPRILSDLSAHDGIAFEGLNAPKGWTLKPRLTVNSAEAAVTAAMAGLGITRVLSYQMTEARRSGSLDIVMEAFEPQPWPVHLVHVRQGRVPLKVRAFSDWAAPRLRASLLT